MHLSVTEFERIPRAKLGAKLLRRLHAFDARHARKTDEWVFDWQYRDYIKAKNWVGVVDIPGLTLEILPKVSMNDDVDKDRAQQNLLYMLSVAGALKVRRRDLASLHTCQAPLLEALISAFADQLQFELGRGLVRSYVAREENARYLKGKLVLREHIKYNAAHRERVYVAYDEFTPDNLINQLLRAAVLRLTAHTRVASTLRTLRHCEAHLMEVSDREARLEDFDRVHHDRNSARFEPLLSFARLVFSRESAGPSKGKFETFSLLFPMETVFESFIGAFIRKHAERFGWERGMVHMQAKGHRRWLLRNSDGGRTSQLKPDVLVQGDGPAPALILDTKWKRLKPDEQLRNNGVSPGDLYQLYAYSQRYQCSTNVLLYPKVPGVTPKDFTVDGDTAKHVRIALIDLSRDLWTERAEFLSDVARIVSAA